MNERETAGSEEGPGASAPTDFPQRSTDSVTHLRAWVMYFPDQYFAGTYHIHSQIISGPN